MRIYDGVSVGIDSPPQERSSDKKIFNQVAHCARKHR